MAKDSTSASTNQKRPQRTAQAQAHQPIRSVHEGQLSASTNQKRPRRTAKRTNQSQSFHEAEKARRSSNQIRLAGSKADASSHQKEASARANRIHRADYLRTDFLWADFLRTDFLRTDPPSSRNRRISQPDPSIGVFRTDYLRTDFLRTNFLLVRKPKIGPAHEWSRTTRVTRSQSPPEYDTSSKETVGNGGRSCFFA